MQVGRRRCRFDNCRRRPLIAILLLVRAVPSLRVNQANFFTSATFDTVDAKHLAFGVSDLFMVTVLSSMCALVLTVPIAVGIAVFLTQYAPARLSRPFAAIVDLLAAVPSIIFGLWGIFVLAPRLELWIPCFIGSVKAGPPPTDAVSGQLQLRSPSGDPVGQRSADR
jgi:ABC-type phosphate transport system permease subunit